MNSLPVKIIAAIQLVLAAGSVSAQDASYPVKPLRIVSPLGVGSGVDVFRRVMAEAIAKQIGQPVVVESRPGAGEVVAAQTVAKATPDGYTLLCATNAILFVKHMQSDIGYDPFADFAPITTTNTAGMALVVRADAGAMRVEELVASAKARPGKMNYAAGGMGSPPHLSGAAFQSVAAINTVPVPFKGTSEAPLALMRGDVDYYFTNFSNVQSQIAAGKMRVLAVTSAARNNRIPEVPTLREVLKSDLSVQDYWTGLWAPAKTPAAVVRRLHAATVTAMADSAMVKYTEAAGGSVTTSDSPEAFAAYMRREDVKWKEIVRLAGAKTN